MRRNLESFPERMLRMISLDSAMKDACWCVLHTSDFSESGDGRGTFCVIFRSLTCMIIMVLCLGFIAVVCC